MSISINNSSQAQLALQTLANLLDPSTTNTAQAAGGTSAAGDSSDSSAILSVSGSAQGAVRPLDCVTVGLNRATTLSDVADAGAQSVSSLLDQLKAAAQGAADSGTSTTSRQALNADYQSLLGQIQGAVDGASFDGTNLLNGSQTAAATFSANADGTQTVTLSATNLSLGGPVVTISATSSIGTASAAAGVLDQIDASIANVGKTLGLLGAQAKQVAVHVGAVAQLNDALSTGAGSLVNANLDAEGARLMGLQLQQQLGSLPQSLVNQSPQTLLSLFR